VTTAAGVAIGYILDGTIHTLSDADELLFQDPIGSLNELP
jgi:hypothetical protein